MINSTWRLNIAYITVRIYKYTCTCQVHYDQLDCMLSMGEPFTSN